MKTLIIFLFPLFSFGQIQTDKVAHFGIGYVVGATSSGIGLTFSNGKHEWLKSVSLGFVSGFVIGTAKEMYDYKDYGVFNYKDLGWTVLGSTIGGFSVKFTINRYEHKHLI